MRLARAALMAWLVVLASCTSPEPPGGTLPSYAEPIRPVPEPGARLLVIRDDGGLVTMLPDGSNIVPLAGRDDRTFAIRQPAWSPDGSQMAWVEVGPGQARLVLSGPAGTDRRDVDLDLDAFFLQWDPTGRRVAYLGNVLGAIGLGVATDGDSGLSVAPVGSGRPFYLAWSPDGERLLVHVNQQQLGITDLEGSLEELGGSPGTFQAPAWLPDGRLIYAVQARGGERLIVRNGERVRTLAAIPLGAVFVTDPGGTRVAYRQVTADGGFGPVYVADVAGGGRRLVTRDPTAAFFWSPRGRDLLLLTVESGAEPIFQWRVWDRGERFAGEPFAPSLTFLQDYVPFFDQYAPGIGLWAPDGSAFAYAGEHDGDAGIWVQEPISGAAPELVSDGSIVSWSAA